MLSSGNAVLLAERENDPVVGGRGLQLEVERHAEALAQRETEGAVDPRAERRVDDELHAAGLVEEALGDQRVLRRQRAEHGHRLAGVGHHLLGAGGADAALLAEPARERRAVVEAGEDRARSSATAADSSRVRARRLAEPERDGRRRALGVGDAHAPLLDAVDPPRAVAEQEDVARHALDGEVLVDGADETLRSGLR